MNDLNREGKTHCKDGRKFNKPETRLKLKQCPWCNKTFKPYTSAQTFCKNPCRLAALHDKMRKRGGFFANKAWTELEDLILREMYPIYTNTFEDIQKKLPGRTIRSIKHRLHDLKIKRKEGWRKESYLEEGNPFFGKKHTPEIMARIVKKLREGSSAFYRLNKDPEFQKKRRDAWHASSARESPNKTEKILDSIIQDTCPNLFTFVGDGSFVLDGLNPDWVCKKKKWIIELFGKAFHSKLSCIWELPERRTYWGRKKAFAEHGYKTLIFWDDEVPPKGSEITTVRKLLRFVKRNQD